MTKAAVVAQSSLAWKLSSAGPRAPLSIASGVRVVLQLASRTDREGQGLAGRLIASSGAVNPSESPHTIVALIHVDSRAGRPRIGAPICPPTVPLKVFEQLRLALDDAWLTAKSVDLHDEYGRPLMLGALHAHPAGVSRWLMHYCQDGR